MMTTHTWFNAWTQGLSMRWRMGWNRVCLVAHSNLHNFSVNQLQNSCSNCTISAWISYKTVARTAQFQRKSVTKQLLELYALLLKSAASVRIDWCELVQTNGTIWRRKWKLNIDLQSATSDWHMLILDGDGGGELRGEKIGFLTGATPRTHIDNWRKHINTLTAYCCWSALHARIIGHCAGATPRTHIDNWCKHIYVDSSLLLNRGGHLMQ